MKANLLPEERKAVRATTAVNHRSFIFAADDTSVPDAGRDFDVKETGSARPS